MKKKELNINDLPSSDQLESELGRENYRRRYGSVLRSTVYILITVAAAAVLIATLVLPVFRIYSSSMSPTLEEDEIVCSYKSSDITQGDVIAFYYNNRLLVKRVIAEPGSWVTIDEGGVVYVDGKRLSEPYVTQPALGECDLEFPFQVPADRYFVLGDNRVESVDSRYSGVGCVSQEQIAGEIFFKVWPFEQFGPVK